MGDKSGLELKVGTFVFMSLVAFVIFVLLVGDFRDWTARYNINIIFHFVDGVKIGSPVRFAGVDIGEVKDVSIKNSSPTDNDTRVRVVVRLKNRIKIPYDSEAWVNTLGLLGEKYIEIIPGKDYSRTLKEKDTIIGTDPIAMHAILAKAYNTVDEFQTAIGRINKGQGTLGRFLFDDKVYDNLEALVEDIRKHPWKLFYRTKEKRRDIKKEDVDEKEITATTNIQ